MKNEIVELIARTLHNRRVLGALTGSDRQNVETAESIVGALIEVGYTILRNNAPVGTEQVDIDDWLKDIDAQTEDGSEEAFAVYSRRILTECTVDDLERLVVRLLQDRREQIAMQKTFDLRWAADMRAIKRWQDATGKTDTWPDHADMVVWLLEQLEATEWSRG